MKTTARVALAVLVRLVFGLVFGVINEAQAAGVAPLDPQNIDALVERAREQHLARHPTWLKLLHYRSTLLGGKNWKSEADGSPFFLAKDGKTQPDAELEATIRALFSPEPPEPLASLASLDPPYCRFPARLAWLSEELSFDLSRLPRRACRRYQEFAELLDARTLTLVFSSYYLSTPASAFGHTFLRVDKRSSGGAERTELELLDHGIDYSASVDTDNAFLYAVKGLTGLFHGVFHAVPYYMKVREYNDYDSRDLWEYELALTPSEVSFVVAHLWELGSTYFDYFYLSENCSYHVLAALEVARPSLRLLDHIGYPVIPADTVRAIANEPGLVAHLRFRPSARTLYRARLASLGEAETAALGALLRDPDARIDPKLDERAVARVLDAAIDLLDYRSAKELVRSPAEAAKNPSVRAKHTLLGRRAAIQAETVELEVAPPLGEAPHRAHGSHRIGLGSGYASDLGAFHQLDLRLALHDLADPPSGYPPAAAIEFLPVRLRYYIEPKKPFLEDLSVVRVTNVHPIDRWETELSWTARVGATRIRDATCTRCLAGIAELGGGAAVGFLSDAVVAFALADAQVLAPADGGFGDILRAGIGPLGGIRMRATPNLAMLAVGQWHYLPFQAQRTTWRADATLRWQYTRGFALEASADVEPGAKSAYGASTLYF